MTVAPRFALSAGEAELRERACALAAPHRGRRTAFSRDELLALCRELRPLGYLGSTIPAALGGAALPPLAFGALVEGLAPALTLLGNHSVQRYLAAFGDGAQQARHLAPLLAGEAVGAIAITERGAGTDLEAIATTARRCPGGYRLDGGKTWVMHGLIADLFVVLARLEDGRPTRFLVPAGTPGLRRMPLETVGLAAFTFADLAFEDCFVPAAERLGGEGEGAVGAKAAFPLARALVALQAVRLAEAAVGEARAFARERSIRGRPLLEREAVQAPLAGLSAAAEALRLLAYRVLSEIEAPGATGLASGCKALATELATAAAATCAEIVGAAALRADHPLARLLADSRLLLVVDGTAMANRLVLARRLLREA